MKKQNNKVEKILLKPQEKGTVLLGREVRARLRFLRMSPRKVNVIVKVVRKMPVSQAVDYLKIVNKAAALPVLKLIQSAAANGEHNFSMQKNNLFIKTITVNQGPSLKRFTPKAFGRATPIRRRMSHVEVILGEIKPTKDPDKKKDKSHKEEKVQTVDMKEIKKQSSLRTGGVDNEGEITTKGEKIVTKKIFPRKTG